MTIYQRELKKLIAERYPEHDNNVIIDTLFEIGVIDYTMCKVLCIREWCDNLKSQGLGIVDAMWYASEHFACSYEYVRKCIYYFKDIGLSKN